MPKRTSLLLPFGLFALQAVAGAEVRAPKTIPKPAVVQVALSAEAWDVAPNAVTFVEHRSQRAMKVAAGAPPVTVKGLDFRDGTIEFDLELVDPRFVNVYFRWNSAAESECFYFRSARAGHPLAGDAVQYAPVIKGVNLWDLLGHFQANADFQKDAWTHVKLVVVGAQMRAYVNGAARPTLTVPRLEGDVSSGTIGFGGEAFVANLVVKPGAVEDVPAEAESDPVANDPRYLRQWQVSPPAAIPAGIDLAYDLIPNEKTAFTPIEAERRGLVNLTRPFGAAEGRRIVWLKARLHSANAQTRRLALGFSDEVWVLIGGKLLYVDKNWYTHPIRKEPEGRCSIENASFALPLAAGPNDLLIGVANDFFGWGIVARLDSLEGISFPTDR